MPEKAKRTKEKPAAKPTFVGGIRLPRVARYIDEEHVDKFLETGEIRLISLGRCIQHEDLRRDMREGRTITQASGPDGSTLAAITIPSRNFYMLCCSLAIDGAQRKRFGRGDKRPSGFVIRDPAIFSEAICEALEHAPSCIQGPCVYRAESVESYCLDAPLFTEDPTSEEEMVSRVESCLNRLDQLEPLFTKPSQYKPEHEYRFVWPMSGPVEQEHFIVSQRAASVCYKLTRRYCKDETL